MTTQLKSQLEIMLRRHRSYVTLIVVGALTVVSCGGSPSVEPDEVSVDIAEETSVEESIAPSGVPVATEMNPAVNGFAFANFGSGEYEFEFGVPELVEMFGDGPDICSSGSGSTCSPTAEAAAFAQMVNQARAGGHCEGFSVVATTRFNSLVEPVSVALRDDDETIAALARGFATQFLPEVQEDVTRWLGTSLGEKVAVLEQSLADGTIDFALGVYTEYGGHSILPYAVEYPTADTARIMVYDSNWPGMARWVDVDLPSETWSFSFGSANPATDSAPWTGPASMMDLTAMSAREGSCPFCGDGTRIRSTSLLIRSDTPSVSVSVNGDEYQSGDRADDGSVDVRPSKGIDNEEKDLKRHSSITYGERRPRPDRPIFDFRVTVPASASDDVLFNLTGPASVFAVTPNGILNVSVTQGGSSVIQFAGGSISVEGVGVTTSLANADRMIESDGQSIVLTPSDTGASLTAVDSYGQSVTVAVDTATPYASVSATGIATVTRGFSDGTAVRQVMNGSPEEIIEIPDFRSTSKPLPAGLESQPLPISVSRLSRQAEVPEEILSTLPSPSSTDGDQSVEVAATTTTVASSTATTTTTVASSTATTTTTIASSTATTTTTVAPSTTTTTVAPSTTTTTLPTPTYSALEGLSLTFGDDPVELLPPDSDSTGAWSFSSADEDVVTVNSDGVVTVVGAGSTTISLEQAATAGYVQGSTTVAVTVAKATPSFGAFSISNGTYGASAPTVSAPTVTSDGALSFAVSGTNAMSGAAVASIDGGTGVLTILNAGIATVTATVAESENYLEGSVSTTTEIAKATPVVTSLTAVLDHAVTSGTLDLPTVSTVQSPAWTYGSTNLSGLTVDSLGNYSLASGGSGVAAGTVSVTLAESVNYTSITHSMTVKACDTPGHANAARCVTAEYSGGQTVVSWERPQTVDGVTGTLLFELLDGSSTVLGDATESPIEVASSDINGLVLRTSDDSGELATISLAVDYQVAAVTMTNPLNMSTPDATIGPDGSIYTVAVVKDAFTFSGNTDTLGDEIVLNVARSDGSNDNFVFQVAGTATVPFVRVADDGKILLTFTSAGAISLNNGVDPIVTTPDADAPIRVATVIQLSDSGAVLSHLQIGGIDITSVRGLEILDATLSSSLGVDAVMTVARNSQQTIPAEYSIDGSAVTLAGGGWNANVIGIDLATMKARNLFGVASGTDRFIINDVEATSTELFIVGEIRSSTASSSGFDWPGSLTDFCNESDCNPRNSDNQDFAGFVARLVPAPTSPTSSQMSVEWSGYGAVGPDKAACGTLEVVSSSTYGELLYAGCYNRYLSPAKAHGYDSFGGLKTLSYTHSNMNDPHIVVFRPNGELLALTRIGAEPAGTADFQSPLMARSGDGVVISRSSTGGDTVLARFVYDGDATLAADWSIALGDSSSTAQGFSMMESDGGVTVTGIFSGTLDVDSHGDETIVSTDGSNDVFQLQLDHTGATILR